MQIKPAPHNVTLEYIENEDDDLDSEVVLAVVAGVGADVKGVKKGDTVAVHKHSKEEGIKIDSTTFVVGSYCIVGVVEK